MIPTDYTMVWAEVYTGIPGRPRTKCLAYGWCACPKWNTYEQAYYRVRTELKRKHGQKAFVFAYPPDRTSGFKASDPIIGIFG